MTGLSGRRVVLTGAGGFLGQSVARMLMLEGAEIHSIFRTENKVSINQDTASLVTQHFVDLTEFDCLSKLLSRIKPEIIFHLAASGGASGKRDRHSIFLNNVYATHNLLLASDSLNCKLIYTGGSLEYGPKLKPISESDCLEPVSMYAAAKAAASMLVYQAAQSGRLDAVIIRPFSIYGNYEPSNRLVPTAIKACITGAELPLTAPGLVRDYVYVEDVAQACLHAACMDGISGEIFNIATGIQTSNEALVELISKCLNKPIKTKVGAYQAHSTDSHHWQADIRKTQSVLNWTAKHTLQQGLEKTIAWYLQNE